MLRNLQNHIIILFIHRIFYKLYLNISEEFEKNITRNEFNLINGDI